MSHSKFRRRTALLLCALSLSALALTPCLCALRASAAVVKTSQSLSAVSFCAEDFAVNADGYPERIRIDSLPDSSAGLLLLGAELLCAGDVVEMSAVDALRFYPFSVSEDIDTQFTYTPVFAYGDAAVPVTVSLRLTAGENSAPVAKDQSLTTYRDVAIEGTLSAVDPDGDALTYQLVESPVRGSVTLGEAGSFTYTPYEGKKGKDSFTFTATDAAGNVSEEATVKITIKKQDTKVTYADMSGEAAHAAALRLAEEGVLVGACLSGTYFFQPDQTVSRSEFVAMAMKVARLDAAADATATGFFDDDAISVWAKGYVSSALMSGVVQGSPDGSGRVVFCADDPITLAQASVVIDRLISVSDVDAELAAASFGESVPAWALQATANLESVGVVSADDLTGSAVSAPLTRAAAAELLCGALEVLEARETGGWFNW